MSGWSTGKSFYVNAGEDFTFQDSLAITVLYYDGDSGKLHLQHKTEDDQLEWYRNVYRAGGLDGMDAVSFHPTPPVVPRGPDPERLRKRFYRRGDSPDTRSERGTDGAGGGNDGGADGGGDAAAGGFGALAALIGLLGAVLLARRRR